MFHSQCAKAVSSSKLVAPARGYVETADAKGVGGGSGIGGRRGGDIVRDGRQCGAVIEVDGVAVVRGGVCGVVGAREVHESPG